MGRLGALPRYLTAQVAGERVGIVHGDPENLAGWRLAKEAMEPGDRLVRRQVVWRGQATSAADLLDWFRRADVSVLGSSHTGLPYAQAVSDGRGRRLVVSNGAAGLPNFAGTGYGVITRLSSDLRVPADSLYGITIGPLRCDALPVRFDLEEWTARFLAQWPPGSPGHPLLLRPHHRRHPPAAGAGGTRRRTAHGRALARRPASHDDVGRGGKGGQATGVDLVVAGNPGVFDGDEAHLGEHLEVVGDHGLADAEPLADSRCD